MSDNYQQPTAPPVDSNYYYQQQMGNPPVNMAPAVPQGYNPGGMQPPPYTPNSPMAFNQPYPNQQFPPNQPYPTMNQQHAMYGIHTQQPYQYAASDTPIMMGQPHQTV